MTLEVMGPPQDMGDEQLIRLHRQLKTSVSELEAERLKVDNELKSRIKLRGRIETPSGIANLIVRKDRVYDSSKVYAVLGIEKFLRVVAVSSTQIKALFQSEPLLDALKLEGCYVENSIEFLQVR
jgi:hypothetical protein